MKKIDLKMLGITAIISGCVLAGSTTSFAAEEEEKEYIRSYNSNAVIEFKAPGDGGEEGEEVEGEKPIDPTDPEGGGTVKPIDPTDPEGPNPGTPGPLSIDFASSLLFDKPYITSSDKTYFALPQKFKDRTPEEGPNYVQVTDNRGKFSGWTLTLTQNGQFKTEKGKVLEGAAISFENGVLATNSKSNRPSSNGKFTLKLDEKGEAGVAEKIMYAKAGNEEGAGTWALVFGDNDSAGESISLFVPGSTVKHADKYSTTLTWKLTDVPGSEGGE